MRQRQKKRTEKQLVPHESFATELGLFDCLAYEATVSFITLKKRTCATENAE